MVFEQRKIAFGGHCAQMLLIILLGISALARADSKADEGSDATGNAAIWIKAIANDNADKIRSLLADEISAKSLLSRTAPNGKTALMVASKKGELDLVKSLFVAGAKINAVTKTGGNAFMFAVLGNNLDTAKWLASKNANVAAAGSNGWSAATIAAAMGHTAILQWLTTLDAPIDSPDVYRFTPLMRAVDNGHLLAAKLLLETNDVNVDAKDEWQNTALHFAMANKDSAMLKLLLENGARMSSTNRDGMSPDTMLREWPEARQFVDRFR